MTDERVPNPSIFESPPSQPLNINDLTHESIIARTATTVVHRVSTATGQSIAVKHPIQQDTVNREMYAKFKQEADNWTQLDDHSHIVGVVDWGEDSVPWLHHDAKIPWIAMEDMDGGTLTDYAGDIPIDQAFWIAIQITDAVWYAHHPNGAVHLDLKPSNILFRNTPTELWNAPKVADWELARTLLNHSNSVGIATPQYTSPEQTRNNDTGPFTDQFQLGIVLYELFTGEYPFVEYPLDAPPQALVAAIADPEVPPPTEYNPELPEALDEVLQTALAADPQDRYETVRDLHEKLTEIKEITNSSTTNSDQALAQSSDRTTSIQSASDHGNMTHTSNENNQGKNKPNDDLIDHIKENTETMSGEDIIDDLKEAKNLIEQNQRKEAKNILNKTSNFLRNTDKLMVDHSKKVLYTQLEMAKSDIKLKRTKILDDLISELSTSPESTDE